MTVSPATTVFELLARLQTTHSSVAVVLGSADAPAPAPRVLGVVTLAHVAEVLAEGMEMFAE